MAQVVIKRDGSEVVFDPRRIRAAVGLAESASGYEEANLADIVAENVHDQVAGLTKINISQIHQYVEDVLMAFSPAVARCYIEYRHRRDIERENAAQMHFDNHALMSQDNFSLPSESGTLDAKNILTAPAHLAGFVANRFSRQLQLPQDIVEAHESGVIHYHDFDYAPFGPLINRLLIDLETMLKQGYRIGNADIELPQSIQAATTATAQIITQVSNHIYSGATINRIDEVLAPYVNFSYSKHLEVAEQWQVSEAKAYALERTEQECYDAFQSLENDVNRLRTANGQALSVTFGFGLGSSWEACLVQRSILKNRLAGLDDNRKTSNFPKLVFVLKEGLNLDSGDPNYQIKQLALRCSDSRTYTDILGDAQVEVTDSLPSPMGYQGFIDTDSNLEKTLDEGRNNLGVVSLNLPRIAIESEGSENRFYTLLDQRLDLAKKALDSRIELFKRVEASVAPILYVEGACGIQLKPDDDVFQLIEQGMASISLGYIGLHEAIIALYGKDKHLLDSNLLQEKARAVLQYLMQATIRWRKQSCCTFDLFGVESEAICHRFWKLDYQKFGLVDGVNDDGIYTNRFPQDVELKVTAFDSIDLDQPYLALNIGDGRGFAEHSDLR